MMFGFGRAGSPSRPVYGLHPHSPPAARRSAPTNNIHVSLNTHGCLHPPRFFANPNQTFFYCASRRCKQCPSSSSGLRTSLVSSWKSLSCLSPMSQEMITEHKGSHRLDHRHRPWQNTGIMTAAHRQLRRLSGRGHSLLAPKDRCSRLECDPKENILSVADPSLNAAGIICPGSHPAFPHFKSVVVFGTG